MAHLKIKSGNCPAESGFPESIDLENSLPDSILKVQEYKPLRKNVGKRDKVKDGPLVR